MRSSFQIFRQSVEKMKMWLTAVICLMAVVNCQAKCDLKTEMKACAILYDEEDCGGWRFPVPENSFINVESGVLTSLLDKALGPLKDDPKDDDAESVVVKKGCTFVGYQRKWSSALGPGKAIAVAAKESGLLSSGSNKYVSFAKEDETKPLDEKIDAAYCFCRKN